MQIGEMYVLAMLIVCAAGGYGVGKVNGFKDGKSERNDTGWEDEAKWWRRNTTGLRPETEREHDE